MTQEQLGKRLEAVTGRPWSKATVSALERSADGVRVRQFDADDLVAIAHVLDVQLMFLFKPSSPESTPTRGIHRTRSANRRYQPPTTGRRRTWHGSSRNGDATAPVGAGDAAEVLADTISELWGLSTRRQPGGSSRM